MAKRSFLKNKTKGALARAARQAGGDSKSIDVDIEGETETKPISTPVRSAGTLPASSARTINALTEDINKFTTESVRDQMNRIAHVLVINVAQFISLIKDHKLELERVARRSDNETVKEYLESIGKGNTYELATKLYKRFKVILEKHLNQSSSTTVRWFKREKGNVTLYYFVLTEKASDSTDVFRVIRDNIMARVREDLVKNSRAGTYRRALSVIIAGIDIDYNNVTKAYGSAAKQISLLDQSRIGKEQAGTGIQLGHFRGPNTVAAARILNTVRRYARNTIALTGLSISGQSFVDDIHNQDAEIKFNDVVWKAAQKELGGTAEIQIRVSIIGLEQTARNSITGNAAQKVLGNFRKWVATNAAALLTLPGSKPIVNMILDDAIETWLVGSAPARRINKRYRSKVSKQKVSYKGSNLDIKTRKNTNELERAVEEDPEKDFNLNNLLAFLNSKLHDKVRENMGKGGSKQILNYQTGRFAKSAKIQSLYNINEKRALGAQVKYMKYPYAVFEPGGRLHKPGRDPHRIFGRSIRQILQEEKIANLRRVKVKLSG